MSSSKSSNSEPGGRTPSRHVVTAAEAGQRLDLVLSQRPEVISREMAQRLIQQGHVLVNTAAGKQAARVHSQDLIEFTIPPPQDAGILAQDGPLDIIYEDSSLVVVNKPAGIPVHPGLGHRDHTLVNYLLAHLPDLAGVGGALRPGIVHRLDKDTSGVLVVAKNDRAHQGLAAQFKSHSIHRVYHAIIIGRPRKNSGTIDMPLARHSRNRFKRGVEPNGKRAVTHWKLLERLPPFALVELRLETGRTHQIRAHLAACDWPVLGDPVYGGKRHRGLNLESGLEALLNGFQRQALHAVELGFVHPESGQALSFKSPPPADMQQVLAAIRTAC